MKFSKHRIWLQELFPVTFVVLLWLVHLAQVYLETDFMAYTLYPRTAEGLIGIVTAPLIHADFGHLFSNTIPLLVCGLLLYLFYEKLAHRIFFLIYLMTGVCTWLIARPAYHLGASGLVYGLAGFLFLSGVLRRHTPLMVVSLLVVFLYGSFVWGVLPVEPAVSWESHLSGGLTGFVFALYFRKQGPQRPVYSWEDDSEHEEAADAVVLPEEQATLPADENTTPDPKHPWSSTHPQLPPGPWMRYIYIENKPPEEE